MKTNTEGVQTTKKWEADVHAKRYNKLRRVGEDNQNGTVVLCLLNDSNRTAVVERDR